MHVWALRGGHGMLTRRPMRVGGGHTREQHATVLMQCMEGKSIAKVMLRSSQAGMAPTLRFQSSYIALESSLLCLVGWGVAMWTMTVRSAYM